MDNYISLDFLYLPALLEMTIDPKVITQQQVPLVVFNGNMSMLVGTI